MTTAVATHAGRLRAAVAADTIALASLAVLATAIAAVTWGTWGDLNNDTGYDFLAAARVAGGDLPYADYVYWYGPLAPLVLGLASALGGAGLAPLVVAGLLVAAAAVGATYALARTQAGPVGAFLAAAIVVPLAFAPNQFGYVLPHTAAATFGLLAVLGVLLAVHRGSPVLAGVAAGAALLTKPEFALAALAAGALWVGLRRTRRDIAGFAVPALAIPAAVYGAFLVAVSPRELVLENLYPVDFFEAAGGTMLDARAPLTVGSFLELGGRLALYAAGAAALILAARLGGRVILAAAVAAGVLIGAASLANPEALRHGLQFVYGWLPAGAAVAVVVCIVRFRRRPGAWTAREQVALALAAALAVYGATTYASFFLHAPSAQMAVYAAPLIAVFLVRLHLVELARGRRGLALGVAWVAFLAAAGLGLTLKDARAESATVRGPGGTLAEAPADAAAYQAAVGWVLRETAPGEPILLAPQMAWLYTLTGRENALPELSLLPGALATPEAERAAIARLEAEGVRLALVDRRAFTGYGHGGFGATFAPVLSDWLERRFVLMTSVRADRPDGPMLELWLRRVP